jgi:hypothetical protein
MRCAVCGKASLRQVVARVKAKLAAWQNFCQHGLARTMLRIAAFEINNMDFRFMFFLQDMADQCAALNKQKVQLQREFDAFKDLTAQVCF